MFFRFQTLSLLGAKVVVAECDSVKLIGKVGVITALSCDCYYLACSTAVAARADSKIALATSSSTVIQLGRETISAESNQDFDKSCRQWYTVKSVPDSEACVLIGKVKVYRILKNLSVLSVLLPTGKFSMEKWTSACTATHAKPTSAVELWSDSVDAVMTASELDEIISCVNSTDRTIYSSACLLYGQNHDPYSYPDRLSKKLKI
jgi:hypothetical protein